MIFTKYFFKKQIDENTYYIINLLVGSIELVDKCENDFIDKWIKENNLQYDNCKCNAEKRLFKELQERKYIIEERKENELVQKIEKLTYDNYMKECSLDKRVAIIPSYKCNFQCPYCFEVENEKRNKIMTKEMVDKIFEINNEKIESILLYGGEPFLEEHKDIIKYIISKAPNALYSAITNGYNLMEYYDILRELKIEYIQITLDGSRKIHNKTRVLKDKENNNGTYDVIMKGIEHYIRNGINIKIRMNIHKNNLYDCLILRKKLYDKFEGKNICFELQPLFQNSLENVKELNDVIEKFDFKETFDKEIDMEKYNKMTFADKPIINYLKCSELGWKPMYHNCNAETINRFYDSYGDVYSCTLAVGNLKARVGTYYPDYKELENSMINRNINSIFECKECKFRFICGGGCAYGIMNDCGDVMQCNCSQIKQLLNERIPQNISKKLKVDLINK